MDKLNLESPSRPVRVMVVEDDAIFRLDVCTQLAAMGYAIVGEADRGDRVFALAMERRPDVILLDITLAASTDGIEAGRRLLEEADIPVVYVTANADDETFRRAVRTRPFGYVLKPVNFSELRIILEIALYKHTMDRRLKQSEETYRTLFKTMTQGVIYVEEGGRILGANDAARAMLDPSDMTSDVLNLYDGRYTYVYENGTSMPLEAQPSWIAMMEGRKVNGMVVGVRRIGSADTRWLTVNALPQLPAPGGGPRQVTLILNDITQRKRMEEELRNLMLHVENVREEERARIAREIHDELGQQLTALKISIASMLKKAKKHDEEGSVVLGLIDDLVGTVRRIATDLRPSSLDDLGLVAAMEWQLLQFKTKTGLTCKLEVTSPDIRVERAASTALFRGLQELLTNVIRHAQCTEVVVQLEEHPDCIELRVHDNGVGITSEQVHSSSSLGFIGIRERLTPLGGSFTFAGGPGQGTTVSIRIPHSPTGEHND